MGRYPLANDASITAFNVQDMKGSLSSYTLTVGVRQLLTELKARRTVLSFERGSNSTVSQTGT
jgi:hypothetical protein